MSALISISLLLNVLNSQPLSSVSPIGTIVLRPDSSSQSVFLTAEQFASLQQSATVLAESALEVVAVGYLSETQLPEQTCPKLRKVSGVWTLAGETACKAHHGPTPSAASFGN